MNVIGTCSHCGGPVGTPKIWHGVVPPTPQCSRCYAIPVEAHGPVIPMRQSNPQQDYLRILDTLEKDPSRVSFPLKMSLNDNLLKEISDRFKEEN